jgi:hypothetical protein
MCRIKTAVHWVVRGGYIIRVTYREMRCNDVNLQGEIVQERDDESHNRTGDAAQIIRNPRKSMPSNNLRIGETACSLHL